MIQVSGLELGGVGLSGSATKMLEFLHATTNSFIRKLSPVIVKTYGMAKKRTTLLLNWV